MINKEKIMLVLSWVFWPIFAVKLVFQTAMYSVDGLMVDVAVTLAAGLMMMWIVRRRWPLTVRTICSQIMTMALDLYLAWTIGELTTTPLAMALLVAVAGTMLEARAVVWTALCGDALIALFCALFPAMAFAALSPIQFAYLMVMMNATALFVYFLVRWINRRIAQMDQIAREADRAAQVKSDFLARASHEIRTPMNAIFGMNELILAAPDDADLALLKHRAAGIKESGMDLLMLINDILDISKMEQGKLSLVEVDYDGSKLFGRIAEDARALLRDKPIAFKADVELPVSRAMTGDDVRIRQIAMSLLGNAIKFTERGEVSMTVGQAQRSDGLLDLTIRVADTGVGMRRETVDKILSGGNDEWLKESADSAGMGIGMSIATRLLSMMGGKLRIESALGQGSRFYLRIPQRPCAVLPEDRLQGGLMICGAKVLVVDDNPANLQIDDGIFKVYGINIEQALSGQAAIDKASVTRYDLIFMDHMMPIMDGVETVARLRALDAHNAKVPIVALTANNDRGIEALFKGSGMDGYISKPLEKLELERVLRTHLQAFACAGGEREAEAEDVQGLSLRLPGVDVELGVSRCGGTLSAYRDVLRVFAGNGPEQIRRMQQSFNADDGPGFAIEAHALKSVSASIGATKLAALAADMEKVAQVSDRAGGLRLIGPLISEYTRVLDAVQPLVQGLRDPLRPRAEGRALDRDELIALLAQMADAADNYDMEAARRALDEIAAHPLCECAERGVAALSAAIETFAYEQTADSANALIAQLRTQAGGSAS